MSHHLSEHFLEACGAEGPLILDVEEAGRPRFERRVLGQPFALIGRKANADLVLDDDEVSRRHAYIQMIGGRLFCLDLDSRTGTHWEHGPGRSGWIAPDQAIEVGPFRLRPRNIGSPTREGGSVSIEMPSPHSRAFADEQSLSPVSLEITNEDLRPIVWPMARAFVLLGRSHECHVRLKSPRVSNVHCSLLRTEAGVWLIDLLTDDGVTINGVRRRFARLAEGDEVGVGRFSIRVRYGDDSAEPVTTRRTSVGFAHDPPGRIERPGELAALSGPPPTALALPPAELIGDPALLPVLTQLGAMQQQMFDQFQQMMMMMAQMFGSMHREHLDLVRDELEQVRRLTDELNGLRAELGRAPAESRPAARPNGLGARPAPAALSEPAGGPVADLATRAASGSAHHRNGGSAPSPSGPRPTHRVDDPDMRDVHAMITQRLAAIEAERESRWQKILRTMRGA